MSTFKMIEKPKIVKVTHALAKEFAEMEKAPGDREISPRRMAYLTDAIKAGEFRTAEWSYCICDGKKYRTNGKHTSNIMAEMNGELPDNIFVSVCGYEAESMGGVADCYCTFDNRASARSTGDINRAFWASSAGLEDVPAKIVNCCVTGIAIAKHGDGYASATRPEERAMAMRTHGKFFLWSAALNDGHTKSNAFMFRGPVVAAMFKTWQKSAQAATEFWSLVRDGSGTSPKTADRKLQKFLLETACANGRGASPGGKMCGQREMMCRCITAWNAWREGAGTELKYFPSAAIPTVK